MISNRVQSILAFTLSRCLYFGLGISFIINKSNNLSIISTFLGFIIGYFILYFLTKKNYYDFFNTLIGKIIITLLSLYIVNYCAIAFDILSSNFYLTNTPNILIVLPFFILIGYGVKCGLPTISRLSEILIIISVSIIILIVITFIPNINSNNYFPIIFQENNFLLSILSTTVFSTTPIIILLSLIKDYNSKSILKGYIFGSLSIFFILISIIGIFGSSLANLYRYPEYKLLQQVTLFDFLEKQENFLAIIWFIDLLITALLSSYAVKKATNNKFNIISIIFILISYIFFINNYQNALFLYNNTSFILLVFLIISIFIKKKKVT